jgi:hypothetical protein
MMASIVQTHDVVYYVDPSIRVMTSHVSIETRFKRPIESFDQCRLYVVVCAGIMTNVVLAEHVLHLGVQKFHTAIRLQHVWNAFR